MSKSFVIYLKKKKTQPFYIELNSTSSLVLKQYQCNALNSISSWPILFAQAYSYGDFNATQIIDNRLHFFKIISV